MMQFLILADDYTDADALNRRLAVRQDHLKRVRQDRIAGNFIIGGAKLNEQNQMQGSMLVVEFENEETVKNWIAQDPYVTGKVWENVQIIPFRVAEV
jgi:uncharacterized protein YciI